MTTETNAPAMKDKQETIIHLGICLLMILLSIGGLAYGVMAGLILAPDALFTLDGILLVLICLSVAGTFAALLLNLVVQAGWVGLRKGEPEKKSDREGGQSS